MTASSGIQKSLKPVKYMAFLCVSCWINHASSLVRFSTLPGLHSSCSQHQHQMLHTLCWDPLAVGNLWWVLVTICSRGPAFPRAPWVTPYPSYAVGLWISWALPGPTTACECVKESIYLTLHLSVALYTSHFITVTLSMGCIIHPQWYPCPSRAPLSMALDPLEQVHLMCMPRNMNDSYLQNSRPIFPAFNLEFLFTVALNQTELSQM